MVLVVGLDEILEDCTGLPESDLYAAGELSLLISWGRFGWADEVPTGTVRVMGRIMVTA